MSLFSKQCLGLKFSSPSLSLTKQTLDYTRLVTDLPKNMLALFLSTNMFTFDLFFCLNKISIVNKRQRDYNIYISYILLNHLSLTLLPNTGMYFIQCERGVDKSTFCSIGKNSSTDSYVSLQHIGKAFLREQRERQCTIQVT